MAWMAMMGADSVDYHRATIVGRADDFAGRALEYYGSRGETPLCWGGSGAARLGLSGSVIDAQYSALFGPGGACDPTTGVRLVGTRRPGMELVVSAHKSVAELGVIGGAEDMHRILDAERDATLAYLDQLTRQRGGWRGRERRQTGTGGLIYAHTRHATSRAGDPCPHDHVLIANLVEMADPAGGWKAADTAVLRDELWAATMVGRMAAARVAVELGYGIEHDEGRSGRLGHWRIAGIPDEVLELHSKRSAEIDAHLEGRGFATARARGVAARETRKTKRFEPVDALTARWQAELASIGWSPESLVAEIAERQGMGRKGQCRNPYSMDMVITRPVLGPDGELARRKVFGRAEVIVAVAPDLFGAPLSELDWMVDRVLADREVIPLLGVEGARDRRYTLASVVATEHAIAARVADGCAIDGAAVLPERLVAQAIARAAARLGRPLSQGQADAIGGICAEGRQISLVLGVAGAGKTTALGVVADAYRTAGYQIIGTATAGQAARTLGREADIPARTVASLRWALDHRGLELDEHCVVILDEAGVTDDADLLYLLSAASIARSKVIVVGDDHQLGPVGPGGALGALLDRHGGLAHVLDENLRQADPTERAALAALRDGDVGRAVGWYLEHDRIAVSPDRDSAVIETVEAWATDTAEGREAVMLAWRRANVDALNRSARWAWAALGRLEGPELQAPGGRAYRAGDRIVTLAPVPEAGLVTSQHGTITAVDLAAGAITARMDEGPLHRLQGEQLGAERLAHSYALTVHRAQGSTVEVAHHLADGGGRELAYVAMSRARSASYIHAVADNLAQAVEDLNRTWAHRTRPRWAIDVGTPTAKTPQRRGEPTMLVSAETARQLGQHVTRARLQAERAALAAAIPPDVHDELAAVRAERQRLGERLENLRQARHQALDGELASAASMRSYTATQHGFAVQKLVTERPTRRYRRVLNQEVERRASLAAAAEATWQRLCEPEIKQVSDTLAQLDRDERELKQERQRADEWWDQHPEARGRLAAINMQIHEIDQPSPIRVTREPPARSQSLGHDIDPPHRPDRGRGIGL